MKRKFLLSLLLSPLLLLLIFVVYVKISDLSYLRSPLENLVSKLLKRELHISGDFALKLGWSTEVKAKGVRLENAEWGSDRAMVEVDELSGSVKLWSFFSGPVHINSVEVKGARVFLEREGRRGGNWRFKTKESGHPKPKKEFPVIFGRADLENVQATYRDRSGGQASYQIKLRSLQAEYLGHHSYRISRMKTASAEHNFNIQGVTGQIPRMIGMDLSIEAEGPDLSGLGSLLGSSLESGAYKIRGVVKRKEKAIEFKKLFIEMGKFKAALNGTLGQPPYFEGTDFTVDAKGPNLSHLSQLKGIPRLPAKAFEIHGHFDGNPKRFRSQDLRLRVGASDAAGSFYLNLEKVPPYLKLKFESEKIDPRSFDRKIDPAQVQETDDSQKDAQVKKTEKSKKVFYIPEDPLDFGFLKKVNGQLDWQAEHIVNRELQLDNVILKAKLDEGKLSVERGEAALGDEKLNVSFSLQPASEGYQVSAHLQGSQLRFKSFGGEVQQRPPLSYVLKYDGHGRSLRGMGLEGQGSLYLKLGAGTMQSTLAEIFTTNILRTIFQTLNPFAGKKKSTKLKCAIVGIYLENGVATLDTLSVRTKGLTVLGAGKVDLKSEALDLEWTAKHRKGIGLSASSITEPYIKLGGTLANPHLEIKPLSAMISTGAAVMTLGTSILLKGVWDRVSAEKKVCREAEKLMKKKRGLTAPY